MADPEQHPRYGVGGARLVLGVLVVPAALLGGVIAWAASVQARLPVPMATHWTFDGTTNGTMSLSQLLVVVLPLALITWALGAVAVVFGRDRRVRFRAERAAMAWCCAVTAFVAATLALTVGVNLDQPSAASAHLPAVAIVVVLLVAAFFGVLGWALAGAPPEVAAVAVAAPVALDATVPGAPTEVGPGSVAERILAVPEVALGPGQRPVWHRHLTSTWLLALTVVSLVAAAFIAVFAWLPGLVLALCALCTAPLASITVVVDRNGLDVRFGPLGWPRKHLPLAAIAAVSAEDIDPMRWGGWGYRILPGRSAVVLRSGPAVVVDLVGGKRFCVTIDDPEPGVALLRAYLVGSRPAEP